MNLPKTMLHIRLETELVKQLDILAQQTFTKRSELIRRAVLERLRSEVGYILPADSDYNVHLLTDQQLDELIDIAFTERMRRRRKLARS